jgi:TetR/AcrR family transcriptional repressor of nem operon
VRKSRAEAAATKAGIVQAASRAFKQRGFNGVAVADLMAEIGLSHGAAYRHFPSKEALVASCFQASADASVKRAGRAKTAKRWMASYLSRARVEVAGDGCAFAALAVDVTRAKDAALQAVFAEGIDAYITALAASTGADRADAMRLFARGVGALLLMRGAGDTAIAREIRESCLAAL